MHRLANALVRLGHDVTCMSFSPAPLNSEYHHVLLLWQTRSKLVRKFIPALKFRSFPKTGYDIIHYHGDDYLSINDARRVRTFYGSAFSEAVHATKLSRMLYQSLFYLFELSSCLKKGTCTGISVTTQKKIPCVNTVIHCGVPTKIYKQTDKKSPHPSLLFIGDFTSRKRGNMLMRIFQSLVLKKFPTAELTVIGPQQCCGEQIRYLGVVSEDVLIKEYQRSWIYCLPSSYEGFGVPAIEAMACGAVPLATYNGGTEEIITNEYDGILCSDPDFANETIRLLNNKSLRDHLRYNGNTTVKKRFSMTIIAQQYEKLYSSILIKNGSEGDAK